MMRWCACLLALAMLVTHAFSARAGDFDERGVYAPSSAAAAFVDFEAGFDPASDYVPHEGGPGECFPSYSLVPSTDALSGAVLLRINVKGYGCAERIVVRGIGSRKTSYRATLWMRHGGLDAQLTAKYRAETGLETRHAKLAPTGRATSDGWIELASNELPVDGSSLEVLYVKLVDHDAIGTEIDAIEVVEAGPFVEESPCAGALDTVCGEEGVCISGRCVLGRLHVPPLPEPSVRGEVVQRMRSLLSIFFGGRKTRLLDLPRALSRIDALAEAKTAWTFWNGFATAIRELHDWHTRARGDIQYAGGARRLNACFIAGDADASVAAWPRHPVHLDVLVSHVGPTSSGLDAGDRLVAIDGEHPIVWALALKGLDWGFWQACDDRVFAEPIERLKELIPRFASQLTVVKCSKLSGECEDIPRTIEVADLLDSTGFVACDNRPVYSLVSNNPGPNHDVGYEFYSGQVAGTSSDEKIRALIWDTLYGGGNPKGAVNTSLRKAFESFKAEARGVILDHRAGNGGTLDGAETATTLMRAPETVLAFRSPIDSAGFDGPADLTEGLALFEASKLVSPYRVGADDHDPELPVAVLLHRDGSASDFFPFGVKGSPRTKIFGVGPTAGAFSTFYVIDPLGPVSFQFASGDSISAEGEALIGQGVEPDEVVLQRQSDLLAGRDTMVEAALAWLRTELKP